MTPAASWDSGVAKMTGHQDSGTRSMESEDHLLPDLRRQSMMTQMIWRASSHDEEEEHEVPGTGPSLHVGATAEANAASVGTSAAAPAAAASHHAAVVLGASHSGAAAVSHHTGHAGRARHVARSRSQQTVQQRAVRVLQVMFWDMIDPRGVFRTQWDVFMALLVMYIMVATPLYVCFYLQYRPWEPLAVVEASVTAALALDVYLNFRTGIINYKSHLVIMDRAAVAWHYLTTWFIPDVIAAIPFEWLSQGHAEVLFVLKLTRVAKLLRMLRVVKLLLLVQTSSFTRRLRRRLQPGVLQIVGLALGGLCLAHYLACIFYYIGHELYDDVETWVAIRHLKDQPLFERYTTSLYWTMSTLGTVGFGDVLPGNVFEKIYAMFAMMIGTTVFAYAMTSMGQLMGTLNAPSALAAQKLKVLDEFLQQRKVPNHLRNRIKEYFMFTAKRQLSPDDAVLLEELSTPLRTELVLYLHRRLYRRLKFFQGKEEVFAAAVLSKLNVEYFAEGETIIRQGDPGDTMYFLAEGLVEVRLYGANLNGLEPAAAGKRGDKDNSLQRGSRMPSRKHPQQQQDSRASPNLQGKATSGQMDQQANSSRNAATTPLHTSAAAAAAISSSVRTTAELSSPSHPAAAAAAAPATGRGPEQAAPSDAAAAAGSDAAAPRPLGEGVGDDASSDVAARQHSGGILRSMWHRHGPDRQPSTGVLSKNHWRNVMQQGLSDTYVVLGTLSPGDHFGEWSMLLKARRSATLVAVDNCELYSLSRHSVEQLLATWPEMAEQFELMAAAGPQPAPPQPQVVRPLSLLVRDLSKLPCGDAISSSPVASVPSITIQARQLSIAAMMDQSYANSGSSFGSASAGRAQQQGDSNEGLPSSPVRVQGSLARPSVYSGKHSWDLVGLSQQELQQQMDALRHHTSSRQSAELPRGPPLASGLSQLQSNSPTRGSRPATTSTGVAGYAGAHGVASTAEDTIGYADEPDGQGSGLAVQSRQATAATDAAPYSTATTTRTLSGRLQAPAAAALPATASRPAPPPQLPQDGAAGAVQLLMDAAEGHGVASVQLRPRQAPS